MDREDSIRMLTALVAQARISAPDGHSWFATLEQSKIDAEHCAKVAVAIYDAIEKELQK